MQTVQGEEARGKILHCVQNDKTLFNTSLAGTKDLFAAIKGEEARWTDPSNVQDDSAFLSPMSCPTCFGTPLAK
jgi:hypothetical protein